MNEYPLMNLQTGHLWLKTLQWNTMKISYGKGPNTDGLIFASICQLCDLWMLIFDGTEANWFHSTTVWTNNNNKFVYVFTDSDCKPYPESITSRSFNSELSPTARSYKHTAPFSKPKATRYLHKQLVRELKTYKRPTCPARLWKIYQRLWCHHCVLFPIASKLPHCPWASILSESCLWSKL